MEDNKNTDYSVVENCYNFGDVHIDKNVTNDIDAMKEVIYRRYYRVLVQDLKKPDLIIE